uniref:Uncharacterized protein n=1 Tax=Tanacetum cinerariifolium TaxID=118510 RepID=A0A699GYF7_TANCI|nr:hypothetical protein [Tanacetum cinerariifolium]
MSDNGTIEEYTTKLSGIASKSAMLGEVLDFKEMGCEDVVGQLKAYKERVKEEDKENDAQEKVLYASTDNSNRNND